MVVMAAAAIAIAGVEFIMRNAWVRDQILKLAPQLLGLFCILLIPLLAFGLVLTSVFLFIPSPQKKTKPSKEFSEL